MRRALAVLLLAAIHCAHDTHAAAPPDVAAAPPTAPAPTTPTAPPASADELVDHWGDSPQTAVAVPADAAEGGADWENGWIFERYGRFKRNAGGTGTLEGRRYNVVKIELESGEKKTVYFDITELWARSQQQQ